MKRAYLYVLWTARVLLWVLIAPYTVLSVLVHVLFHSPTNALYELEADTARAIKRINEPEDTP